MPAIKESSVRAVVVPIGILLIAMLSIQCSASVAKSLFAKLSPEAVTALRLLFSTIFLFIGLRPWRIKIPRKTWKYILLYGITLGCMNLTFYMSIARIPLGIAVAIEFSGPLVVSVCSSRRWIDFAWLGLAVAGLIILLPIADTSDLDPVGVMYAFGAAIMWGLYILFGKRAGADGVGAMSVPYGALVGTLVIFPIGFASAGGELFALDLLPYAVFIGLFSSALPYALEMSVLAKMPSQVYGILMSLEPAIGTLSGFLFLGEQLTLMQGGALICISAASIGATLSIHRS